MRILDPGAGAGVLFAACVEALISRKNHPLSIEVVAYETDRIILPYLEETMKRSKSLCVSRGVSFHGTTRVEDFVSSAIAQTEESLFIVPDKRFTHDIMFSQKGSHPRSSSDESWQRYMTRQELRQLM